MSDTIKQRTKAVPCIGRTIVARRMAWKATRDFLKKLSAHIREMGVAKFDAAAVVAKLPEIITSADDLTEFLLVKSTDLTLEQINDLDTLDGLNLIEAALEVNLDDELKKSFAGIAAKIGALSATMTPSSEKSTAI